MERETFSRSDLGSVDWRRRRDRWESMESLDWEKRERKDWVDSRGEELGEGERREGGGLRLERRSSKAACLRSAAVVCWLGFDRSAASIVVQSRCRRKTVGTFSSSRWADRFV